MRSLLFFLLSLVACNSASINNNSNETTTSSESTTKLDYTFIKLYPHNTLSFTEGLEFADSTLLESTGDTEYTGKSKLAKIKLATGGDVASVLLDKKYFGEGITKINGKIFMMTYKEETCFVFDAKSLKKLQEIKYQGEGWGLTNNGKQIINSNGSSNLFFRNATTFAQENVVAIFDENGPVANINELEFVDGFVYANIWQKNIIVKIDINKGVVVKKIDLSPLINQYVTNVDHDVLNGIAYNKYSKTFFITGKNYPVMFEVKF
jgi:glutaminyl-peptide cyclotransferase